jgi:hypothetical protein
MLRLNQTSKTPPTLGSFNPTMERHRRRDDREESGMRVELS